MAAQLLMDRVAQGAADGSAAMSISAQRVLTAEEMLNIMREFDMFSRFVSGLSVFAQVYRSGSTNLVGAKPSASMFCFWPSEAHAIDIGPGVTLAGGMMMGGHFVEKWDPPQANLIGPFRIRLDGVWIIQRSLYGIQVLPYIYALPEYMYRAFGGFIDELASSLLRSTTAGHILTTTQRSTLNKIVSGDLKGSVAEIAKTPLGIGESVLLSGTSIAARQAAEADGLKIVEIFFPFLHRALIQHQGIGTVIK